MVELDLFLRYLAPLTATGPTEVRARLTELRGLAADLQRYIMDPADGHERAARARSADLIDELRRVLSRVRGEFVRALPSAPPQVQTAFRDVDLDRVDEGLRAFGDWLRAPTPESTARAEQLFEQLRNLGVTSDWDSPEAERARDAELDASIALSSAQMHAELASSFDDVVASFDPSPDFEQSEPAMTHRATGTEST